MRFPTFRFRGPDTFLQLPLEIYGRMLAYARASEGEISGWGKTKLTRDHGDTLVTVVDIRLFTQSVMSVHTSLDGEALTKWYIHMATKEPDEDLSEWNLWWHSHNDMPTFFSSIDDASIIKLRSPRLNSICINKNGDLSGRIDTERGKTTQEVPVRVLYEISKELEDSCKAEVKEKVRYEHKARLYVANDPEIKSAVDSYIARFKKHHDRGWGKHVDL